MNMKSNCSWAVVYYKSFFNLCMPEHVLPTYLQLKPYNNSKYSYDTHVGLQLELYSGKHSTFLYMIKSLVFNQRVYMYVSACYLYFISTYIQHQVPPNLHFANNINFFVPSYITTSKLSAYTVLH